MPECSRAVRTLMDAFTYAKVASHRDMCDPLHSREPAECKFPDVESVRLGCLGCQIRQSLWGADHNFTPGQCKHATTVPERTDRAAGVARTGHHPRELGRPDRQPQDGGSSSSSSGHAPPGQQEGAASDPSAVVPPAAPAAEEPPTVDVLAATQEL